MKDFKAISRNYMGKIKSNIGLKSNYGKAFENGGIDYFRKMFESRPNSHQQLLGFLKNLPDVKTIAEIGCSIGMYPIKFKDIFTNYEYTGYDFAQNSIDYCKENSNFKFICTDFIKSSITRKYDFVFSMGVVDHVYDIDLFVKKIVEISNKYAYINVYRGYFPDIENHKMNWNDSDGVYYSDVSVKQIRRLLIELNLSEEEFEIIPSETNDENQITETVIKIMKNMR